MKRSAPLLFTLLLLTACNQAPVGGGGPEEEPYTFGTTTYDAVMALAEHSSGVYALGETRGELYDRTTADGGAFLRKYDRSGKLLWGKQFGGFVDYYEFEIAHDAVSDKDDNVYMLYSSIDISGKHGQLVVQKYTPQGELAWTHKPLLESFQGGAGIAIYEDAVYVTGNETNRSDNSDNAVLVTYSTAGQELWRKTYGPQGYPNVSTGLDVDVDSAGNVYVVGSTRKHLIPSELTFLSKLDVAGNEIWTEQFGALSFEIGSTTGVAVSGDSVYVIGSDPDDNGGDGVISNDVSVLHLSPDGELRGTYTFGVRGGVDKVFDIDADSSGVVFSGTTETSFAGQRAGDEADGYVYKIGFDGAKLWSKMQQTLEVDSTNAVLLHSNGELYAAGATNGSLGSPNKGDADGFLRRLDSGDGATVWTK